MLLMVPRHPSDIDWDDPVLPPPPPGPMPAELARQVRATFFYIPPWTESLRWSPWVLQAVIDSVRVRPVHLDAHAVALLRLVVAQDNSCRYCYGTARLFLRLLGYSEGFVRALERDLLAADLDPPRRAALDFARQVSRANPRPGDEQRDVLRGHGHDDAAIAELAAFAALWVMGTRITTLGAVAPHPAEGHADHWAVRFSRPLLGYVMRRKLGAPPLVAADPTRRAAAFDALIDVFDGLPVAANLRRIVDAAFIDGGPLPRRTRVILTAVIVRALGCDACERQLAALLGPGDPSWAEVDAMLRRLDADWLDERERLLVPVARDIARTPQPRAIQRRMLELRRQLGPAEFVDFVGLAAVACALGRLGALVRTC